ncbi:MAG: hypothetical protein AB8H03_26820 [Saprospiraceae bacterium]
MINLIISILLSTGIITSPSEFNTENWNQANSTYQGQIIITDDIAI